MAMVKVRLCPFVEVPVTRNGSCGSDVAVAVTVVVVGSGLMVPCVSDVGETAGIEMPVALTIVPFAGGGEPPEKVPEDPGVFVGRLLDIGPTVWGAPPENTGLLRRPGIVVWRKNKMSKVLNSRRMINVPHPTPIPAPIIEERTGRVGELVW